MNDDQAFDLQRVLKCERDIMHRQRFEELQQRDREILQRWSDKRFRALVSSVNAGNHAGGEGWEANPPSGLSEVFPLTLIAEEAARRGLPDLRVDPA